MPSQNLKPNSPEVKQFIVVTTFSDGLEYRDQKFFETEAQAKDYAARYVTGKDNRGSEAYVFELTRIARLPIGDVDWQVSKGRSE